MSKFYQVIQDSGDIGKEFLRKIEKAHQITLFAPSNAAWEEDHLKDLIQDPRMREIFNMHLLDDQRLPLAKIMDKIKNRVNIINLLLIFFVTRTSGVRKLE